MGQVRGNNLFHSFGTFNVGTSESATFTGPANINNIIGRVTGGGASQIDGTIRSTIEGANLFLLNPAGVMFGPNASLDVSGSFHVSTADYLKFSDGRFYANTTNSSVLSTAEPEAFGFLSSSPAGITGDRAFLQVPEGKTISIVGGDITYTGYPLSTDSASPDFVVNAASVLTAPGGRINLVSLASTGEVRLSDLDTGAAKLGKITFSDGAKLSVLDFDVDGNPLPAGSVVIRGGQMLFKDGGVDIYGNPGGEIDIRGDSLHLDSYYLYPATLGDAPHPGTACRIDLTSELLMTHSSLIDAQNLGQGRGGDIRISAGNIKLGDDTIDNRSFTGVDLGYYGYISSTVAPDATGRGGNIYLTANGNLTIQNGFFLSTRTVAQGDAGNITVNANKIQLLDQGNIATDAFGQGKGGLISVTAGDILISGANMGNVTQIDTTTGLAAHVGEMSDGGKLQISADNLQILAGGRISTVLFGEGHGADLELNAKNITVSGYYNFGSGTPPYTLSAIDGRVYDTAATGTGGNIAISTGNLRLENGGNIRTSLDLDAPGKAGNITINANRIDIAGRGQINADSFRGVGNSGDISLSTKNLTVTGATGSTRPDTLDFDFTGLSTTTKNGSGGRIDVFSSGDILLTNGGGIKADTQGTGVGGAINLTSLNILLNDFGSINASSTSTGNAGNISIQTGALRVERGSSITTQAGDQGAGGTVTVMAEKTDLATASLISSSASGAGKAGNIAMALTGDLSVSGGATISADTKGAGAGGAVSIEAANILLTDKASVAAASSGSGNAGNIDIRTGNMRIEKGGAISTRAQDLGAGGTISVTTANLTMANAGQISSSSSASGNAGDIAIASADSLMMRNASITTESIKADGGNISISAPNRISIIDSKVTASVGGGKTTTGGNVSIDPEYLIVRNGQIVANAYEGTGGNIRIVANTFLTDALSVVDASSALGISGTVEIQAPTNNISGLLSPLATDYVSASALLRERCIARIREGKYSSFVVGGRDGLPIEPGNLLPSLPY